MPDSIEAQRTDPTRVDINDDAFNSFVFDQVPERAVCLDVGCWTGNLGSALIRKKNCIVDGLDFNKEALQKARERGYRETFCANLNNDPLTLPDFSKKYDFIICADVIEHVIFPDRLLSHLSRYLSPEGKLLVSVPNIAFVQQRIEHMLGRFDYNPQGGIMDATHFAFYTKRTIEHLLRRSGFRLLSSTGYALVRNRYCFLRYLSKWWPELFAPQLILTATASSQTK